MRFQTTNRSLIRLATGGASTQAREALSRLCETYWPPVYAFVRLRGHAAASAEDMTQAYFALFLEKGYLRDFRPEAGRFRTFLRASIAHFLANEWDRAKTLKRGGGRAPLSLDGATAEERLRLEPVDRLTPEAAFERQWALAVLSRCLERLRCEQEAAGAGDRFERLKAFLSSDGADAAYSTLARELGPRRVDRARRGPPPAPALRRDPPRRGPADRERPGRGRGRDPVPAGGGAREAAGGRVAEPGGEAVPRVRGAAGRGVHGRGPVLGLPPVGRAARGRERGAPAPPRASGPGSRPRELRPALAGVAAPAWAMPAELVRQASHRLRLAGVATGLFFAGGILLNNVVEALGWYVFANPAIKNALAAVMVAASAVLVWIAHTGRLTPARLLRVSLGYEVAVALAISVGDHLEPYVSGVPLAQLSWLCVWIVAFPLFVPASPRWALLAGVAAASTWPLAYPIGRALGNPAVPWRVLALDSLEGYIAAAVATYATVVIRGLQELGCYRLVEKLDHGGMGEIWRARTPHAGTPGRGEAHPSRS